MRWSEADLRAYEAKQALKHAPASAPDAAEVEDELHRDVLAACHRRGWLAFHGSMAHKTKRTLGEPDFTILADNGRVLFVECKSRTGKLSPAQMQVIAAAKRLGHDIVVVSSLREFIIEADFKETAPGSTPAPS